MSIPGSLLGTSWVELLERECEKRYWRDLQAFVARERSLHEVFPPAPLVYRSLELVSCEQTEVVIVGQDPYPRPGQADGLCFSVPAGLKPPTSLANIHRELHDDLGLPIPDHGSLEPWAKRGVLLLNVTLTVRMGEPGSHRGEGWERFTEEVIAEVAERSHPVFLLWGRKAQRKKTLAAEHGCTVIESPHPSRAARWGFFGSEPFSRADRALRASGKEPIDWDLSRDA